MSPDKKNRVNYTKRMVRCMVCEEFILTPCQISYQLRNPVGEFYPANLELGLSVKS